MTLLRTRDYHFRRESVMISTIVYILFVVCVWFYVKDALALGYALVIPTFVYLYSLLDKARVTKLRFWSLRAFVEVWIAFAIAAGIAFLGYRLWLMGY